ncbi:MAG: ubiquinol-cytochrome c reductase iron-sulfur subunit [Bacteroidetes bacterium]|nr:ubiquinol-cytochrome c reductase iron-sulfur subunit [Bacteroidota bacterium]
MKENSRRSFLTRATQGVLGVGLGAAAWPYLRSLIPNVLYEPPRRFKVGLPDRFPEGVTFLEGHRVYVFRKGSAFHCISAVCSHLGCTVKFSPSRQKKEVTVRGITYQSQGEFHCPCHGSKFRDDGTNYMGPAPSPLEWHELGISPEDGQLVVNLSRIESREFRLVI